MAFPQSWSRGYSRVPKGDKLAEDADLGLTQTAESRAQWRHQWSWVFRLAALGACMTAFVMVMALHKTASPAEMNAVLKLSSFYYTPNVQS